MARLTTEYIDSEDRLRLCGEVADRPTSVWLTQRLLRRTIPHLLQWLDDQVGAPHRRDLVHDFAQESARTTMTPLPQVEAGQVAPAWIAIAADIVPEDQAIRLTFRGTEDKSFSLYMNAVELRQWLAILHPLWLRAEWPRDVWPGWVAGTTAATQSKAHMH